MTISRPHGPFFLSTSAQPAHTGNYASLRPAPNFVENQQKLYLLSVADIFFQSDDPQWPLVVSRGKLHLKRLNIHANKTQIFSFIH